MDEVKAAFPDDVYLSEKNTPKSFTGDRRGKKHNWYAIQGDGAMEMLKQSFACTPDELNKRFQDRKNMMGS